LSGTNKGIALAASNDNFDGKTCVVSGWGHMETGIEQNYQLTLCDIKQKIDQKQVWFIR